MPSCADCFCALGKASVIAGANKQKRAESHNSARFLFRYPFAHLFPSLAMWQFLYFFPLPHQHRSFRPNSRLG